jgi:hypothetical protein
LCPGRVTLDKYLVRTLGGREMRYSRERKDAGNEISHENRSSVSLSAAPHPVTPERSTNKK